MEWQIGKVRDMLRLRWDGINRATWLRKSSVDENVSAYLINLVISYVRNQESETDFGSSRNFCNQIIWLLVNCRPWTLSVYYVSITVPTLMHLFISFECLKLSFLFRVYLYTDTPRSKYLNYSGIKIIKWLITNRLYRHFLFAKESWEFQIIVCFSTLASALFQLLLSGAFHIQCYQHL